MHALSAHHALVPPHLTRAAASGAAGETAALPTTADGHPCGSMADLVVQPGPYDRGRVPADVIGRLARFAPLGGVDAALVTLDLDALRAQPGSDLVVDLAFPEGPVTATAPALGDERVAKVGRTTALTHGRVSAIELDALFIDYGEEIGEVSFDGQIEIESADPGPFSLPGDSGALVYRTADQVAIGLVFAGAPGTDGDAEARARLGLTYATPIDAVLDALGVDLAR